MDINTIPSSGPDAGLGTITTAEGTSEVSEQDLVRVSEQAQKAGQMRQQIQNQKANDVKYAQFLKMLLEETAENEPLINQIFKNFFKDQYGFLTQNVQIEGLIGLFAPFYQHELEQLSLLENYSALLAANPPSEGIEWYTSYIKTLINAIKEMQDFDRNNFVELVFEILYRKKIIPHGNLDAEQQKILYEKVLSTLYADVV